MTISQQMKMTRINATTKLIDFMTMKPLLLTFASALLLSACFEVPVDEERQPPKTTTVDTLSAEQVMQEHSPEFLQYEPISNTKTRFYDANGRIMEKETKGGFYRKVLGKTPHNRLVLQDFYQDTEKPYTLPFVAVSEPQLKIFHGAGVRDSRTVWLKPDGTLLRVSDFKNGKAVGETWFFERNKAFAYIKLLDEKPKLTPTVETASAVAASTASAPTTPDTKKTTKPKPIKKTVKPKNNDDDTTPIADEMDTSISRGSALMRFFYPNGTLMAEIETDGNKQHKVILFYPNGATMLQIEDDGSQSSRTAWDAKGGKVAPADVAIEADVLALRIEHGLNLMGRNKGSLADVLLSR